MSTGRAIKAFLLLDMVYFLYNKYKEAEGEVLSPREPNEFAFDLAETSLFIF